jgi:glycogen debranching enzyme
MQELTILDRRRFLAAVGAATLAGYPHGGFAIDVPEPKDDAAADIVHRFLDCSDPAMQRFAADVFRQCLVNKICPAEPPFQHRWINCGGLLNGEWVYKVQCLWDSMFAIDLLAIVPENKGLIREIVQNYWDLQSRWDAVKPDYAKGMIACLIHPKSHPVYQEKSYRADWRQYPAYSQIPIIAWGIERVYRRNGDLELVRTALNPLERFHDWYWRERDLADKGLICVGAYSGTLQEAKYETFDFECNIDKMTMTPHPTRNSSEGEGSWYGDICIPGNTAYLILAEQCLARLAQAAGDHAMAQRRLLRAEKGIAAMRQHMWDEKSGCFLAVQRDTLEKIPVPTIGSWIALYADVPTPGMATRMVETLVADAWMTPLPLPTVGRNDPRWGSDAMWRGDTWPSTNYQIASGLRQYGYRELAAKIIDANVDNAMKVGIYERYDSVSGKPLGVPTISMSCTLLTMVLDGLSNTYSVKVAGTT